MWNKNGTRRALALALALLLLLPSGFAQAEEAEVTVRCWDPLDCTEYSLAPGETLTLAPGPKIEGYRFLGWQDAWGSYERRGTLRVYEDTDYYAVYAIALESAGHAPYLSLDEDGFFHPAESVTRRELALLVYSLLHTELVGDGEFLDVSKDDPCHDAAATLKTLGALSGSRFHPDETVTRAELFELLSHFFPAASGEYAFSDLSADDPAYPHFALAAEQGWLEGDAAAPNAELTRAETAHIFNRVLGRSGDSEGRTELVGTLLDVPRSSPYYWDVAEAVIPHSCEADGEGESWTESEALPAHEAGLFFVGVRLHAVREDGDVAADCEYLGLSFNSRGEATSGSDELDELIWAAMEETVDPAVMSRDEMLEAMFDYAAREFHYVGRNIYEVGETGWEQQEALDMLRKGKGNCYSFAAIFYYFARALGYDAKIYSGLIRSSDGQRTPHGWVEITMDGETFIFDTEMQFLYNRDGETQSFYGRDEHFRSTYGYQSAEDMD